MALIDKLEDHVDKVTVKYPNLLFYIGGDLNLRIGDLNQMSNFIFQDNFILNNNRNNLDKKLDSREKKLVDFMEKTRMLF